MSDDTQIAPNLSIGTALVTGTLQIDGTYMIVDAIAEP